MRRCLAFFVAASFFAAGPATAATEPAYIVVDANNGAVLLHSQADQPWYPASVTKLMTAYLTFQALRSGRLKLSSPVKISQAAASEPSRKMGFKGGTVLNVDNALKIMLVWSANDIAVAVAETVGGSKTKFVEAMNTEASRLGMASTRFANPNGWHDDGQFSTARDLAVLARAIWLEFPEYRDYFGIPAIKSGKKIMRSANQLLEHFPGAKGMKTGYTCPSGLNLAASAERNGRTLIAVVLGARSAQERTELTASLLSRGFRMWAGPSRPQLASFGAGPSRGSPVNMREQVCGKQVPVEDEDTAEALAARASASGLVPRFVLMEPVAVYTGRADPEPGEVGGPPPRNMPMPRLRPRNTDETAALPGDQAPLPLVANPN
jgi:D-alanyl-D-alanine carboxypeptidase